MNGNLETKNLQDNKLEQLIEELKTLNKSVEALNDSLKYQKIVQQGLESKKWEYIEIDKFFYTGEDNECGSKHIKIKTAFGIEVKEYSDKEIPEMQLADGYHKDDSRIVLAALNAYGSQGWEVISVREYVDNTFDSYNEYMPKYMKRVITYTLKREIQG